MFVDCIKNFRYCFFVKKKMSIRILNLL